MSGGQRSPLDRGYAWVVLLASFVAAVIGNGYMYNVGIYTVVFHQHFGQSRAVTSWIAAAQGTCLCAAGPVASILLPRLGARRTLMLGALIHSAAIGSTFLADSIFYVITTFGIGGFGGGLMITSNLACVALYFDRYLYLATGLVNAGVGVGIVLLGVQIQWTLVSYGWRGAMLLQAGVALQSLVCAALVFNLPEERRRPKATPLEAVVVPDEPPTAAHPPLTTATVFRDLRFMSLLWGFFLYFALLTILMGLLKDLVVNKGLEACYEDVLIIFGVSNTLGRALSGWFAGHVHPPVLFFVASSLCALAVAGMAMTSVRWLFLAAVGLLAFNSGQQAVLLSLTLSFLFSREMMAVLFGYGMFLGAMSIVTIAPLTGYMIDTSGSFDSALLLASGGLFACGLCFLFSYVLHRRKSVEPEVKLQQQSPEVGETEPLKPYVELQSKG